MVERTLAQASTQLTPDVYAHAWKEGLTAPLEGLLAERGEAEP
jgi:hypothetical protein